MGRPDRGDGESRAKRRPHGTGHVFRPKYRTEDGKVHEQQIWWVAYRVGGRLIRESAETSVKKRAEDLLLSRLAAVQAKTITATTRDTTLTDLKALVVADYQNNGRRSLDKLERSFRPLLEVLGATTKAASVDAAAVEAYKAVRRDLAKPATINRELAALRRGFRLAVRLGRLGTRPDFSLLREDNVRRGFFEADQFRSLVKHLPDWLAPVIVFLYWTGARRREATSLEWRNVNRKTKTITLEKTKTDVPRSIPYGALPALVDVVNGQWRRTEAARKAGAIIPWVFHREGKPIDDFREAWGAACKAAGLPGKIPHDFRRTAARNMLRAGIPQSVAMLIGGWKTDSVFRRYAIVDEKLISENLAKLAKVRQ